MADQDRDPSNESIPVDSSELIEGGGQFKLEFLGEPEARSKLFEELAAAVGEFDEVVNETEGQIGQRKFSYADLSALKKATRPHLSRHKIVVLQFMTGPYHIVQTPNGAAEVHRVTTLLAGHGAEIRSHIDYRRVNDLKGWGLQTTYLRRYAYRAIFGLDGSDDADNDGQFEAPPRRDTRPMPPQASQTRQAPKQQATPQPAPQQAPQAAPKPAQAPPKVEAPPSAQRPPSVPPPAPQAEDPPPPPPQRSLDEVQRELGKLFRQLKYRGQDAEALCVKVTGAGSDAMDMDGGLRLLAELERQVASQPAMH